MSGGWEGDDELTVDKTLFPLTNELFITFSSTWMKSRGIKIILIGLWSHVHRNKPTSLTEPSVPSLLVKLMMAPFFLTDARYFFFFSFFSYLMASKTTARTNPRMFSHQQKTARRLFFFFFFRLRSFIISCLRCGEDDDSNDDVQRCTLSF